MHLSRELSGTWDAARLAAEEVGPERVRVVDSRATAMGLGFAVLAAADARGRRGGRCGGRGRGRRCRGALPRLLLRGHAGSPAPRRPHRCGRGAGRRCAGGQAAAARRAGSDRAAGEGADHGSGRPADGGARGAGGRRRSRGRRRPPPRRGGPRGGAGGAAARAAAAGGAAAGVRGGGGDRRARAGRGCWGSSSCRAGERAGPRRQGTHRTPAATTFPLGDGQRRRVVHRRRRPSTARRTAVPPAPLRRPSVVRMARRDPARRPRSAGRGPRPVAGRRGVGGASVRTSTSRRRCRSRRSRPGSGGPPGSPAGGCPPRGAAPGSTRDGPGRSPCCSPPPSPRCWRPSGCWWEAPRAEPVPDLPALVDPTAAHPGPPPARCPPVRRPTAGPPAPLVVAVAGRVVRPGLVRVPAGARVADVLEAAGGPLPGTDLAGVNLARRVSDGEQVAVGVPGATGRRVRRRRPAAGDPPAGPAAPAGPLDLNAATVEQLDALPGVGPVTAQRIVEWRTRNGRFAVRGPAARGRGDRGAAVRSAAGAGAGMTRVGRVARRAPGGGRAGRVPSSARTSRAAVPSAGSSPPPAVWAVLLLGLGAGPAARRRRSAAARSCWSAALRRRGRAAAVLVAAAGCAVAAGAARHRAPASRCATHPRPRGGGPRRGRHAARRRPGRPAAAARSPARARRRSSSRRRSPPPRPAGARWRGGGRVLLIAPAEGWSTLLPGQRAHAPTGLLAPATRADLTVAVLRVRGASGTRSGPPPWWQTGARARCATACAPPRRSCRRHPAGLLPGLAVGDTRGLPPEVERRLPRRRASPT